MYILKRKNGEYDLSTINHRKKETLETVRWDLRYSDLKILREKINCKWISENLGKIVKIKIVEVKNGK